MTTTTGYATTGYAPIRGLDLYWECSGSGGTPLILLHGGFGSTAVLGDLRSQLAQDRQVIAVDLQGHGRTRDIDRPLTFEAMGDDIGALIEHLDLGQVDVMGYSMGGLTALRAAIQHPDRVRRLIAVSIASSSDGWYPDIRAQMKLVGRQGFPMMRQTPLYEAYAGVAPDVDAFPALMDKMGALMSPDYDWSGEVRALEVPTMLVVGDADSMPISYVAELFALLGGGLRDGGWDGSGMSKHRLAILPGTTHYDAFAFPALGGLAAAFLAG